jgi:hypothetical protein
MNALNVTNFAQKLHHLQTGPAALDVNIGSMNRELYTSVNVAGKLTRNLTDVRNSNVLI